MSQPREVCATNEGLVAAEEVAVVESEELFMALKKVKHFFPDLGQVKILNLESFGFEEVIFADSLSDLVEFSLSELCELGFFVDEIFVVARVAAKHACELSVVGVSSHHVKLGAHVAVEGSVAHLALDCSVWKLTAVANVRFGLHQMLESSLDVDPLISVNLVVVADILISFQAMVVEKEEFG